MSFRSMRALLKRGRCARSRRAVPSSSPDLHREPVPPRWADNAQLDSHPGQFSRGFSYRAQEQSSAEPQYGLNQFVRRTLAVRLLIGSVVIAGLLGIGPI